ncbi:unnamed protein product [Alopecurus aequalis]
MHGIDGGESSGWTRRQDKLLEMLICRMYPRWDRIAAHLGDKTPDQARERYGSMVDELRWVLESPWADTPPEWDLQEAAPPPPTFPPVGSAVSVTIGDAARTGGEEGIDAPADDMLASATAVVVGEDAAKAVCMAEGEPSEKAAKHKSGRKRRKGAEGRNKAVPWSEDEHKLFLAGIREHGTGKWQMLSRDFVTTRNASQIASHYQKYTIRQAKLRRNECKRPSIHDMNDDTRGNVDRGDEKPPTAPGEDGSRATDDESADEDEVAFG